MKQKNMLFKWIILLAIIYIGWGTILYFLQEKIIFQPSYKTATHPLPKDFHWENVKFPTHDGEVLHGWWLETKNATHTVLFFHGNAGNISFRTGQLYIFKKLGLNALIFDYRGYGESTGKIKKEEDLYRDGQAALKFLQKQKNIPLASIIFWGRSIGTAIAVELAQNKNISHLILEAPFFSLGEIAQKVFPLLPAKYFMKYKFRNDKKIKNISAPLLIFHSKDDDVIPFSQGKKLFENANEPKTFVELQGTHNRTTTESISLYISSLEKFFPFQVK